MSTFTFNVYLVQDIDGDGTDDYVLQDDGRIIISTQSITVDTNFRYIGGQIARKPGSRPALTFTIKKRPNNTWYLLVNRTTFCGLYSNREDCLGVLYGYYTNFSGHDDGFANWLADSLEKGSVLDPDENILSLARAGDPANDISVTLASINTSTLTEGVDSAVYQFGLFLGWQTQQPGSSTWDAVEIGNIIDLSTPIVDSPEDLTQTTTGSQWATDVPENGYVRPVVIGVDSSSAFTVIADGAPLLKDDADDTDLTGLSLSISGDASAIVPVEVGGFAYALVDESGAVLDPGETITYTYDWYREIPELIEITSDASPPTIINWTQEGIVSSVSNDQASLNSITISGETNFTNRGGAQYRRSSSPFIEMLIDFAGGNGFVDLDDFMAKTTNHKCDFYYNGTKLAATSYVFVNQNNTILRARAIADLTTVDNFWSDSTSPTGKTILFELSYDLV